MSESLSSFSDTQTDVQNRTDRLRDRINVCIRTIQSDKYTPAVVQTVNKELTDIHRALPLLQHERIYVEELIDTNQYVATHADHRNVEVMLFGLQQLADHLANPAKDQSNGHGDYQIDYLGDYQSGSAGSLLRGLNELYAVTGRSLLSQSIFVVPQAFRVSYEELRIFQNDFPVQADPVQSDGGQPEKDQPEKNNLQQAEKTQNSFSRDQCYLEFSQLVLAVYRGENRSAQQLRLSALLNRLAEFAGSARTQSFWLACSAFISSVELPQGEMRPAVYRVFKQLEKVVMSTLANDDAPVLGIQQNVDNLLCNSLVYAEAHRYRGKHSLPLQNSFQFTSILDSVNLRSRDLTNTDQTQSDQAKSQSADRTATEQTTSWLHSSVKAHYSRLLKCSKRLESGSSLNEEGSAELIDEVRILIPALTLFGVDAAPDNLREVIDYLDRYAEPDAPAACATSAQLVAQQMLYQFRFLASVDDTVHDKAELPRTQQSGSTVPNATSSAVTTQAQSGSEDLVSANLVTSSAEFGIRCNARIDVIQQALDAALGSSVNLMPDKSVVNALSDLIEIVTAEGVDDLIGLLQPLSSLLNEAMNFSGTLNQSDTLLVQEAINAATLGIDSLVSNKPMPEHVEEVSVRIAKVAEAGRYSSVFVTAGDSSLDGFLNESEELLPRLYELFQRWRGAPYGTSRLHNEIARLLHNFKRGAEEVSETSLALHAHLLESVLDESSNACATVAKGDSGSAGVDTNEQPLSDGFFDLALESIECLTDDIEQLRNNEATNDHSDLLDRLKIAGAHEDERASDYTFVPLADQADDEPSQPELASSKSPLPELAHQELAQQELAQQNSTQPASTRPDLTTTSAIEADHTPFLADHRVHQYQQLKDGLRPISHHHGQLTELLQQLAATTDQLTLHQNRSTDDTATDMQALLDRIAQLSDSQSTAIDEMATGLFKADRMPIDALRAPLLDWINLCADSTGKSVHFTFASLPVTSSVSANRPAAARTVQVRREMLDAMITPLKALLHSIVTETIDSEMLQQSGNDTEHANIDINFRQSQSMLTIEVSDDGCGVVVQGLDSGANDPWNTGTWNTGRYGDQGNPRTQMPQVSSKLNGNTINIKPLIEFVSKQGGTVAVGSDDEGSVYRFTLPVKEELQEVVLIEVGELLFALPAAQVKQVSDAYDPGGSDGSITSVAQLMGISSSGAFNLPTKGKVSSVGSRLRCITRSGLHDLLVDRVAGHRSMVFSSSHQLMPDLKGYLGASVVKQHQIVLLINLDYWL